MSDTAMLAAARIDSMSFDYELPTGAEVSIAVGEKVRRDHRLARLPAQPEIVALANELRLPRDASRAVIRALDTSTVEAGAVLGRNRSGLRMRTVRASCSGIVQGMPTCGAIVVRPSDTTATLRARYPGVVASITSERVTVESPVIRRPFAFADGPWRDLGRLAIAEDPHARPTSAHSAGSDAEPVTTALAHISDVAEMTATLRRVPGPLIVGTVSDEVAWQLLTGEPSARHRPDRVVIVLVGPGDEARGAAALRTLQRWEGATLAADHRSREIIIIPDEPPDSAEDIASLEYRTSDAVFVDPARWYISCTVRGTAAMGLLETGGRALLVRTSVEGVTEERTPVANLAFRPE